MSADRTQPKERLSPLDHKLRKSYRLTKEAVALLEKLSAERGVSQTAIVEQAIRAYARGKSK